tara:strand:- start:5366 stop:6517 length:1152 start_codon:yes stop_codon:yes gene_type:complete
MVPEFEKKMGRVVRRAAKLGLPAPAWTVSDTFETRGEAGHDVYHWVNVTLTGAPTVRLEGWGFAGIVEHCRETGMNVVKAVPGYEIPEHMRHDRPSCDHCQKVRLRKSTYVVQHDDGRFMRVGKNCLRDFLGHDPVALIQACNAVSRMYDLCEEGESWGFRSVPLTQKYMEWAAFCVRTMGYRKTDLWNPTRDTAHDLMRAAKTGAAKVALSEQDCTTAQEVIEWAKGLDPSSEYLHNVKAVLSLRGISPKNMGIAASAITAYQREQARKALATAAGLCGESRYIGKAKTRFGGAKKGAPAPLPVLVLKAHTFEGSYGTTTVISAVVSEGEHKGARILTFRSGEAPVKAGESALLSGTVKRHQKSREGVRETLLTRTSWEAAA